MLNILFQSAENISYCCFSQVNVNKSYLIVNNVSGNLEIVLYEKEWNYLLIVVVILSIVLFESDLRVFNVWDVRGGDTSAIRLNTLLACVFSINISYT